MRRSIVGLLLAASSLLGVNLFAATDFTLVLDPNPAWEHEGNRQNSGYADLPSAAGDVNGDGFADVLINAPEWEHRGRMELYLGSASGLSRNPQWSAYGNPAGPNGGSNFSASSATGDFNGDGFNDVAIGAPIEKLPGEVLVGVVYVYAGSTSGYAADPAVVLTPPTGSEFFGQVSSGDINGDGYADLLVTEGEFASCAYVYLGSESGIRRELASRACDSSSLQFRGRLIGDVNGDGYADAALGDRFYGGWLSIYYGSATGFLTQSTSPVPPYFNPFPAGDANGDGFSDVFNYVGGAVSLYYGSATGISLSPSWTYSRPVGYGLSLASVGDLNGDGHRDVILISWSPEVTDFAFMVFLGSQSGLPEAPTQVIPFAAEGRNIAIVGDVDGDRLADVVVGYPYYSNDLPAEGKAWYYTHPSALLPGDLGIREQNGNGVLEPGEIAEVVPSWFNDSSQSLNAFGTASAFRLSNVLIEGLIRTTANYGIIGPQNSGSCNVCYSLSAGPSRGDGDWDVSFLETLSTSPVLPTRAKRWNLHVGNTFTDVSTTNSNYSDIETLVHHKGTAGCGARQFCPSQPISRSAFAVILATEYAASISGTDDAVPRFFHPDLNYYNCNEKISSYPPKSRFVDIDPSAGICKFVNYLAFRGVTGGCDAARFCPSQNLTNAAAAVWISVVMAGSGAAVPYAYTDPDTGRSYDLPNGVIHFTDLTGSPYSRFAHYMWARGVTDGCSDTAFCPNVFVTRQAAAHYVVKSLGLHLYEP